MKKSKSIKALLHIAALILIWLGLTEMVSGQGSQKLLLAKPLLGRPTDRSVTINIIASVDGEAYLRYGTSPGDYIYSLPPKPCKGSKATEIEVTNLLPNRRYYYHLKFVAKGDPGLSEEVEGGFHTQRARGCRFVFTIQSDVHLDDSVGEKKPKKVRLYCLTLSNVVADAPDFHIDLGDFARIEVYDPPRSATSLDEAMGRYLSQRRYLSIISPYVPIYLVLGNHEGEQGWRRLNQEDSLEVWGTLARKSLFPNPYPNGFYSGDDQLTECCGLRQNYYAWEWGDALFVVLDPFWYTTSQPHSLGSEYRALDGWEWTLGKKQYDWLYETLHRSEAKWKLVFAHHMTGGVKISPVVGNYGRGGIDAAKWKVAHQPTFEWGGEDSAGNYVFQQMRPGWSHGPIHDMMVEEGVDILFRGHDHVFVYEKLDGVVYQTCPSAANPTYSDGYFDRGYFSTGIKVNNSGHIRVMVSPDSVRVDYIRAVLPEDEPLLEEGRAVCNRDIGYSYILTK